MGMALRFTAALVLVCALSTRALAQPAGVAEPGGPAHPSLAQLPFRASEVLPLLDQDPGESPASVSVGLAPLALSSKAPSVETSPAPAPPDWLVGIALPDIPIRWDDRVTDMLRYFKQDSRGQSLMRAWLQRSGRYGAIIRHVLRRHNLPDDLLYVAMVESGFDPSAQSGVGALGLWQFMTVAGDEYGLQRSRWIDERLDPERSTEAAARFLKDLHARFGAWELALAAYNMGHGALVRSIRKYNTNDYWTLSQLEAALPYETMVYVAKIMACAVVGRNPERFGFQDLAVDPAWDFQHVDVPSGIPLQRIARAAGVEPETLAALNPALLRQRVPPEITVYSLRIPAAQVERFNQSWTKQHPTPPSHRTYTVRFGEELADIASMFRTTTVALKRLNEIEFESEVVPGYQLLVPAVPPRAPERSAPPVVSVPRAELGYPGRQRIFYTCTGRESPAGIARFFGVDLDDLRRWNALSTQASLQRGMVIQIFVPEERRLHDARVLGEDEVALLEVGSDAFFDHHEAQRGRVRVHYRVQPGESLQTLASRFDLSVGSIARINGFSRDTTLRSEQEIVLYVPEDAIQGLSSAQLASAPTARAVQDSP
jgi:membrane-bound lytic murein transglycosylase D